VDERTYHSRNAAKWPNIKLTCPAAIPISDNDKQPSNGKEQSGKEQTQPAQV
jgi:hypothetical protein